MINIEKMHKKMYKLILSSCTIKDIKKINQYIEDDKKRILNQDFDIELDCADDNILVKTYVDLYRCKVFDHTIMYKYENAQYDMDKIAITISPLYYAEKLVVKKYNELLLAAKQQSSPVSDPTEFPVQNWEKHDDVVPVEDCGIKLWPGREINDFAIESGKEILDTQIEYAKEIVREKTEKDAKEFFNESKEEGSTEEL